MQNKKSLAIIFGVFVAVLALAGIAYTALGEKGNPIEVAKVEASAENERADTQTNDDAESTDTPISSMSSLDSATNSAEEDLSDSGENAGALVLSDFSVLDRDRNEIALSSMYGKPALVGFWATWCPPCNSEAPTLQKLYDTYGDRINFMMIDVASDGRDVFETAYQWADENSYTYPIYVDETGEATLAGQVYYLPTMYVLDSDGNVLTAFSGALSEEDGTQLIEDLLAL